MCGYTLIFVNKLSGLLSAIYFTDLRDLRRYIKEFQISRDLCMVHRGKLQLQSNEGRWLWRCPEIPTWDRTWDQEEGG